jgi:hypothetical protein
MYIFLIARNTRLYIYTANFLIARNTSRRNLIVVYCKKLCQLIAKIKLMGHCVKYIFLIARITSLYIYTAKFLIARNTSRLNIIAVYCENLFLCEVHESEKFIWYSYKQGIRVQ